MFEEIRRFHSFGESLALSISYEDKAVGSGSRGREADTWRSQSHESDKPSCRDNPHPIICMLLWAGILDLEMTVDSSQEQVNKRLRGRIAKMEAGQ
jgi:hypothetical protein